MRRIYIVAIAVVFLIGLFFAAQGYQAWREDRSVYCTQEAKLCPDGSYVGRTGPNCEFAACPAVDSSWKTYSDNQISFRYPENLATQYIATVDWPPEVQVLSEAFSCTEVGSPSDRSGETRRRMVDGKTYCVTTVTEGAAGSIYSLYAYETEIDSKVIIFTFSLRYPQCANYPDPQKTACENERQAFDLDSLMHRIAQTAELKW